jgi:hypothetical protein
MNFDRTHSRNMKEGFVKSPRTWVALFGRYDSSTTGVGGFAHDSELRGDGSSAGFWGRRTPSLRLLGLTVIAATAFLALAASPASAATFNIKIGEITGLEPGESFGELKSESVADNDHIYVADNPDLVLAWPTPASSKDSNRKESSS